MLAPCCLLLSQQWDELGDLAPVADTLFPKGLTNAIILLNVTPNAKVDKEALFEQFFDSYGAVDHPPLELVNPDREPFAIRSSEATPQTDELVCSQVSGLKNLTQMQRLLYFKPSTGSANYIICHESALVL